MVLSGSKKASYISSISNINQGGGSKKAGLPYEIGRTSWTNIAFRGTSNNLSFLQMNMFPNASISRPIGSVGMAANSYFHIPGTR